MALWSASGLLLHARVKLDIDGSSTGTFRSRVMVKMEVMDTTEMGTDKTMAAVLVTAKATADNLEAREGVMVMVNGPVDTNVGNRLGPKSVDRGGNGGGYGNGASMQNYSLSLNLALTIILVSGR